MACKLDLLFQLKRNNKNVASQNEDTVDSPESIEPASPEAM